MASPDDDDLSSLTAEEVDRRLRQLAELSKAAPPTPPLVDMSREAVDARIRECAEISALAASLARAGAASRGAT